MSFLQTNVIEKSSVQVAVRVRPINTREVDSDTIIDIRQNSIHIIDPSDKKKKNFNFDYAFDSDTPQETVFEHIGEKVVSSAYSGYNCCIFAYGQSGCFSKGTPVMLYDGSYKAVEDVVIGDILMGDDSTPRNVLQLFRGRENMYRVKPKLDGHNEYTVNEGHTMLFEVTPHINVRWVNTRNHWIATWFDAHSGQIKKQSFTPASNTDDDIKQARLLADEFAETLDTTVYIVEMTISEYMALSINKKKYYNCYTTGIDFPEKSVDLDPYLLGLWLGDGTTNNNSITNIDTEIIDYLEAAADAYGCTLSKYKDLYTFAKTGGLCNPLRVLLRQYNVLGNKHIPDEYKMNSREIRMQVLAGLIDTDGYYDHTGNHYEITQKSKRLAEDIIYLARSLGLYASINQCQKGCVYKGEMRTGTYYRCYINGRGLEEMPVLLPRKMYRSTETSRMFHSFPPEITLLGEGNYYGFMLDGNHRFVGAGFNVLRNSGKSHSILGSQKDPGLIPRICQALFDRQATYNGIAIGDAVITYKVELSYLEIYSEEVKDLLVKAHPPGGLKVRQHPELGPYVEGLSQVLVEDYNTIKKLVDSGNKERTVASTALNDRSSRSHAICTLYFTQLIDEPSLGKTREVVSKVNLVDLAGSERVEISGVTGINFKEAININKSLSTLGLVISKLAASSAKSAASNVSSNVSSKSDKGSKAAKLPKSHSAKNSSYDRYSPTTTKVAMRVVKPSITPRSISKSPTTRSPTTRSPTTRSSSKSSIVETQSISDHIPFRDSVLTWILKESLGGNSKTFMLATVSPSEINYNESLSTLRYAYNAKQIINTVKVNEDPSDKLIRVLKGEIDILRAQLSMKGADATTPIIELKQLKEELAQREELMKEKDKSWEQKLDSSKRINQEVLEKAQLEKAQLALEYTKKIEAINLEKEIMMRDLEQLRNNPTDKSLLEEELAKKQAEFEKGRIVDTAVSLQEYYEKKLELMRDACDTKISGIRIEAQNHMDKIQRECDAKLQEIRVDCNAKLAAQSEEYHTKLTAIQSSSQIAIELVKDESQRRINEHTITSDKKNNDELIGVRVLYSKLKDENAKCMGLLSQQTKQFATERTVLSRQIQQLQAKIHSLESSEDTPQIARAETFN